MHSDSCPGRSWGWTNGTKKQQLDDVTAQERRELSHAAILGQILTSFKKVVTFLILRYS